MENEDPEPDKERSKYEHFELAPGIMFVTQYVNDSETKLSVWSTHLFLEKLIRSLLPYLVACSNFQLWSYEDLNNKTLISLGPRPKTNPSADR